MNKFKAKRFCIKVHKFLLRNKTRIPNYQVVELSEQLLACKESIQSKGRQYKKEVAKLEATFKRIFPIPRYIRIIGWFAGLIGALFFALLIRSMLFEPYKIPSGSMRPTLLEKDLVLVNKSNFGINIPFVNKHFLFSEELVKRLGITVFSGWGLDIPNNTMMYFFVFPGIKQYIKRVMAKPGDHIYFYGGKIWGIDSYGNDITELRKSPTAKALTWVPYIYMDGKKKVIELTKGQPEVGFFQMGIPILKAWISKDGHVLSEFFTGNCWSMNFTTPHDQFSDTPTQYRDLWGLGNYATVRLLKRDQKEELYKENRIDFRHELYMEIFSIPSVTSKAWQIVQGKVPVLIPNRSIIPLNDEHLIRLMRNMYTVRFVISNGKAYRYNLFAKGGFYSSDSGIEMWGLDDGVYEFEKGICYEIGSVGNRSEISQHSDVYSIDATNVVNLFNFGITFDQRAYSTMRYCFYNMGELYALNGVLFDEDDAYLKEYVEEQKKRENTKTQDSSFYPFIDQGPPVKDGRIDVEFIKAFGLKISKKRYVLMGDNYAVSADSRDFGFVREGNLRGTASFIFWPFSSFGYPMQPSYFWFTFPKVLIWLIAILAYLGFRFFRKVRTRREFDLIKRDS